MAVNVQYSIDPSFYGIPFFTAQDQRAQRERAERERRAIESQQRQQALQLFLDQALANRAAQDQLSRAQGAPPLNITVPPAPVNQVTNTVSAPAFDTERYKADLASRDRRAGLQFDYAKAQLAADQSQVNNLNDIYGGLMERNLMGNQQMAIQQMMGDRMLQEQQMQGQDRLALEEMQGNVDLRNQAFGDIPQDILEGVKRGFLRYSPEQKTERNRLQQALGRVRHDPTLSPAQRMQAEAMLAEQMRDIDMNPERVPPDEWPKTLPEMFDEETSLVDIGGQQVRVQRGERNGMPTWSVIEPPKDQAAEAQIKQQEFDQSQVEFDRTMQEKDQDQQIKVRDADVKFHDKFFQSELDSITQARTEDIKAWKGMAPDQSDFTTTGPSVDGKPGVEEVNQAEFDTAKKQHQAGLLAIYQSYQPAMADIQARWNAKRQELMAGGAMSGAQPPVQQTPTSGAPMQQNLPTPPQDGAQIIGPNPAGRYAKKYPDGRIELLPEGFAP